MSDSPIYDATTRGFQDEPSPGLIDAAESDPLSDSAPVTPTPVSEPSTVDTLKDPPRYAKALMGAALAGTGAAAVASADGFTQGELWGILATVVGAFVGVYGIRNRT